MEEQYIFTHPNRYSNTNQAITKFALRDHSPIE